MVKRQIKTSKIVLLSHIRMPMPVKMPRTAPSNSPSSISCQSSFPDEMQKNFQNFPDYGGILSEKRYKNLFSF